MFFFLQKFKVHHQSITKSLSVDEPKVLKERIVLPYRDLFSELFVTSTIPSDLKKSEDKMGETKNTSVS